MAKNLAFLALLLILSSFSSGDLLRTRVAQNYTREIGVREATGRNDGARVETYLRSVGLPKGQPWCAAFVHFCLTQGGVPNPINGASGSALNQRHLRYYQNHLIAEPQRADVFVIYEHALGRIGHTGFYNRRVNRSFFETVEGNTNDNGSRDGIGVFRRIRSFHTIYAISSWIN